MWILPEWQGNVPLSNTSPPHRSEAKLRCYLLKIAAQHTTKYKSSSPVHYKLHYTGYLAFEFNSQCIAMLITSLPPCLKKREAKCCNHGYSMRKKLCIKLGFMRNIDRNITSSGQLHTHPGSHRHQNKPLYLVWVNINLLEYVKCALLPSIPF